LESDWLHCANTTNHSSLTTILLPVFASYKALRTDDHANLVPWLVYWITLSLVFLVETHLHFVLKWVPFYAWIRLGMHIFLVLPGQTGSTLIYQNYIRPFLESHERRIDEMIIDGRARAVAMGINLNAAIGTLIALGLQRGDNTQGKRS
jgi:receptor expression-enhancing protein 1/2/3/4